MTECRALLFMPSSTPNNKMGSLYGPLNPKILYESFITVKYLNHLRICKSSQGSMKPRLRIYVLVIDVFTIRKYTLYHDY